MICICFSSFGQLSKEFPSLEDQQFNEYFKTAKIPEIQGKIININPGDLKKIRITYSIVTLFENFQTKKTTGVQSDGSFNLVLDYSFPYQQIWFRIGDSLYTCLYANSGLHIEIDASRIDKKRGIAFSGPGLKFYGPDAELTTLMNNHILFNRNLQLDINKQIQSLINDNKISYDDFIIKFNELFSKLKKNDDEFKERNPSDLGLMIDNERESRYYGYIIIRSKNNTMDPTLWREISNHKSFTLSNDGMFFYRNLLADISIKAGKYRIENWNELRTYSKIDDSGKNLIDSLTYYQKNNDLKSYYRLASWGFTKFSDTLAYISTVKTIKFLDSTFTQTKSDYLKTMIGSRNLNEQIILNDLISKNIKTEWCKSVVSSENQKLTEKLPVINAILNQTNSITPSKEIGSLKSELPFDAKLYEVNSMKAEDFLSSLKASNKGKALLIDFWATWCSPCLLDLQYSRNLHDATKDLQIEYIYLCTSANSNIDLCKSIITDLRIPGDYYFVDASIITSLMNLLSVNGFPSIVFIDKNGVYKPGVIKSMFKLDKSELIKLNN